MTHPGDATSGTSATSDSTDVPDCASPIDGTNRALYERPDAAGYYVDRDQLQPAERAIFAQYAGRLRDARILDLGIGAGRTTGHLLAIAGSYVGVDYSAQLVAAARERFPEADLRVGMRATSGPSPRAALMSWSSRSMGSTTWATPTAC